jgi:hypothetical protein
MSGASKRIDLPEDHYTLFNATRDDLPEIIVVNDALLAFPHTDVFPWHLRVRLDAKVLAENGMPTPEESQRLFEVGDRIEEIVLGGRTSFGARNALFLARSTWNELRELYYCVHDPEITHAALQALIESGHHERHWEYKMNHDPQWNEAGWIFRLFPLANGQDA